MAVMNDPCRGKLIQKPLLPAVYHCLGVPFLNLVGGALIGKQGQKIPQQDRIKKLND